MSTWTIYRQDDGRVVSVYTGADLALNVPAGCAAVEGGCDPGTSCVVRVTDDFGDQQPAIAAWTPPAPPDDEWQTWTWDAALRTYRSVPTVAAVRRARVAAVQREIEAQEIQQARPQRDVLTALIAGQPAPAEAAQRLQEIEAAIVPLRARRAALEAATTVDELNAT